MTTTDNPGLARKTERTFYLVCANFAMLFILFTGLGLLLWQSLGLVNKLKQDLARAEQTIVELRDSVRQIDGEAVIDQAIEVAVAAVQAELTDALPDSEALAALSEVPEKLETTTEAIRDINEKIRDIDAQLIAQQVSYEVLKGLGDGFSVAAESRKP